MRIDPRLHESDLDFAERERVFRRDLLRAETEIKRRARLLAVTGRVPLRLVTTEGLREVDTADADPAWFDACEGEMACTAGDSLPTLSWRARLSLAWT